VTPRQAATQIFEKITAVRAEGREPVVIFDLDGTLYDNSHRMLRILQEYAHEASQSTPGLLDAAHQGSITDMSYKMTGVLKNLGFDDPDLAKSAEKYWARRFFTNPYLAYDLPVKGGAAFAHAVRDAGGTPTYLTGRDAGNMLLGTIGALQRDGFPVGTVDTRMILKPDFNTADRVFKKGVLDALAVTSVVVGVFDNEPGLCNMFKETHPDASVFWLDMPHAPNPPPLRDDVVVIPNFEVLS
jgi:hypothetical protein